AILLVLAAGIGVLANSGLSGSQASMAASGTDTGVARNPGALVPAPPPATNQGRLTFGSYHQNQSVRGGVSDLPGVKAGVDTTATSAPNVQQEGANGSSSNTAPTDLSKIIRDGQIAITIDDGTFKAKAGTVAHIAAVNGGSILSSSTEGGDSGSFTVRVPAANFDEAMVQLSQLGTVDSSASQGQDVTAQYVDLKAHMKIYLSRRKV